jgi:hypothetical protein
MTHLLLEIPQNQDLELLLLLLKKFEVRVIQRTISPEPFFKTEDSFIEFVMAGLPDKPNFEEYVRDFEESRKDKPLPFREN